MPYDGDERAKDEGACDAGVYKDVRSLVVTGAEAATHVDAGALSEVEGHGLDNGRGHERNAHGSACAGRSHLPYKECVG